MRRSLVSHDALFTSVTVEDSITIIRDRLQQDTTLADRTNLTISQVVDLLRLCLTTTYFIFDGTYYVQVDGVAMGSPVSPIVCNIFMEHFEAHALATFTHPIKFWGR